MKKTVLITYTILFSLFIIAGRPVQAKNNIVQAAKPLLSISPAILNITLSPGKTYEYDVTVQNLLNVPLPLRARMDAIEESEPSPLLSWTTVTPTDNIIPAHGTQKIHLVVKLPSKISLGGYYATLFLEPVVPHTSASVQAKVGVIILASIGVKDKIARAEILNFKTDNLLYEQGPITTTFSVKNMSLYHFSAKPILTISSLFGPQEQKILDERIILPGKTRDWESSVDLLDYRGGIYKIQLAVSVGEGRQIVQTSYFFAFPYSGFVIGTIILLLVLVVVIKRRNIKKALVILIGRNLKK